MATEITRIVLSPEAIKKGLHNSIPELLQRRDPRLSFKLEGRTIVISDVSNTISTQEFSYIVESAISLFQEGTRF